MRRFREAMGYCGLMDLGYMGFPYTWSKGMRGVDNIREWLVRTLANVAWRNTYQQVQIKHLPRYKSDHSPVMIECETTSTHNVNSEDIICFDLNTRASIIMDFKKSYMRAGMRRIWLIIWEKKSRDVEHHWEDGQPKNLGV